MYKHCNIRVVTNNDLPMLLNWRNHHSIRSFMFTQHEISLKEHNQWFATASQDKTRRLMIVEELQIPIGYVQFSEVVAGGISHWGFNARPDAPKGSGKKMGLTALSYAFDELKLSKVCGKAIATNEASIGLHQKLGFQQEGLLREHQYIGDTYHSLICFGLLAQNWQSFSKLQGS